MFSGNVALCYPNRIEEATLSGGNYLASLPLSNVKNRVLAKRARTVNTLPANTKFSIVLSKPRPILSFAIAAHNFSTSAQIRIRLYNDALKTNLAYDSGLVNVWTAIFDSLDLEWEFDNFWSGTITEEERSEYTPLFVHFLNVTATPILQYIDVDIFDDGNPDGYLEFGRVFIADAWQPTINASLGLSFGYDITTEIETTLNSTEYFDRKNPRRTVNFTLDHLTVSEAFGRVAGIQRSLGIDREVLFAYNSSDDENSYQRRFLGRLTQADPIAEPYVDSRYQSAFNIIEII